MKGKRFSKKNHKKYGGVSPSNTVNTVTPDTVNTVTPDTVNTVTPDTVNTVTPDTVNTVTPDTVNTVTPDIVNTVTPDTVNTVTPIIEEVEEYSEPEIPSVFIFNTTQISTQPNTDTNYKEVGIIHVSESAAIRMDRNVVENVYNTVGAHRFDTEVFDSARNLALNKLQEQLTENHKVSNLRMELSKGPGLIFVHLYGSILHR